MKQNRFNYNFFTSISYFLKYGYVKEFRSWRWLIKYYLIVIVSVIIAGIFLFNYFQVLPPKNTTIAVGEKDSSTHKMAKSFQKTFAAYNLNLKIVHTEGPQEGLFTMEDKMSPVNASFFIAGHINEKEHPDIVSLGSVQNAPIWFFYQGDTIDSDDPVTAFKGKTIAIGMPSTATNNMFRRLFDRQHINIDKYFTLKELSYDEAESQFLKGDVDAMFLLSSLNTPLIQKLIKNPAFHIFDFKLADAYVKTYPNLEKITVPRGAFDIESVLPAKDITLLSTSIVLLTEKGLHPAIQWAFMLAARQNNRHDVHFFSKPGEYPKDIDRDSLPLSPIAERYYSSGVPEVFTNFPLWMASLIDQIWIKALAFFVLIYPILMYFLSIRSFASGKIKNEAFAYLRYLKTEGGKTQSRSALEYIISQIDDVIKRIATVWCSPGDAKDYIELIYLAKDIKAELNARCEEIVLNN